MTVTDAIPSLPPEPTSLEQSGLSIDLLIQLVLKMLHFAGTLTGLELSKRLGLPFTVLEPAVDQLKWQAQIEIVAGAMLGSHAFKYRITDAGRNRAVLFLQNNHYVGVAPVPLAQYQRYISEFRRSTVNPVTPERIRKSLGHLVLSDRILEQLGPAVRAGRSMFVYGPPGNGKTVISQAIHGLLDGTVGVPHALEVEGAMVRFYDPVSHQAVGSPDREAEALVQESGVDRRWVVCRRPCVMVGGELTLDSLELGFNTATGFYRAPIQALANGGLLVIDDFGRQHCRPQDLLNRWIVPLESGVDYLTLQTGLKFEMPFAALVVFATNIKPTELVDEAFLRRIQYKVFAENPTIESFERIFENCCQEQGVQFDSVLVRHLLQDYFRPRRIALRGCQPRDLINRSLALADYLGQPRQLTAELLESACETYFVDDREVPVEYA